MLIHEVEQGAIEHVADRQFVFPPGASRPHPLPDHLDVFEEKDGTKSLSGPLTTQTHEGLFHYYLIHGTWTRHKVGS